MAADYNPRAFVLLLLFIIYFTPSPDIQQPALIYRFDRDEIIDSERAALDVLNNTNHGDFDPLQNKWLNVTGLRQEDGYSWDLLRDVREKAFRQASYALGDKVKAALGDDLSSKDKPVQYKNVSGIVRGDWSLSDDGKGLERRPLNLSAIAPIGWYAFKNFDRNITSPDGTAQMDLNEPENGIIAGNGSIREIVADMRIEEGGAFGSQWELLLRGVHYVDSGHILLSTTSEKYVSPPWYLIQLTNSFRFAGIFALPHMALTNNMFLKAQDLLSKAINRTIEKQTTLNNFRSNPWTSIPEGMNDNAYLVPHCEFIVYLQQHPLLQTGLNNDQLTQMETEMRYPTGAPMQHPPKVTLSMTAFSPDCGFVIQSKGMPDSFPQAGKHLQGWKREAYAVSLRHTVEVYALILAAQLFFLMRQMKETSTPSTRNRVSYYSMTILAMADGMLSLVLLIFGAMEVSVFYTIFATFFLGFASVLYLQIRFILDIWVVQYTEALRQRRQHNANSSSRPPSETPVQEPPATGLLPLPAVAPSNIGHTGATPVILPSDQDVDAEAAADASAAEDPESNRKIVYVQFMFSMIVLFFLSAFSLSWPPLLRRGYAKLLIFLYLSFLCPQIYRNVVRNCRKALRWDFILGQSLLRLLPIVYLYGVQDKIINAKADPYALYFYMTWVWLQILALLSQEHLGPRFFVPDGWAPPAYDYHPVLREDEENTNLPIGSTETSDGVSDSSALPRKVGESRDKGKRVYDCTICGQDVEVPVIPAGSSQDGLATNLLARRNYMVTPCRHIFHFECLNAWMRYRLQCPNCREILPPL